MGTFHVVPEVLDDLGVEGLGTGYPSGFGFEVCVFDVGAELGELDVDLIVTEFRAYTPNLFSALIPM